MKSKSKIALLSLIMLLVISCFAVTIFATDTQTQAEILLSAIAETPPTLSGDGKTVTPPSVSDDAYTVSIYGTSNSSVIDTDGNVYTPLVDTEVSVTYKVTSKTDENDFATNQYKEAKIMIKGKYQTSPEDNKEPAVLPKLQEWKGESGFVTITESSKIVTKPLSPFHS